MKVSRRTISLLNIAIGSLFVTTLLLYVMVDPSSPTTFHQYDHYDKGETYTFTSWEYVHVFLLRDGSIVTHVT
ncbi:MAG: hypothetical protein JW939_08880, partial [Candidatus Thermoplasmatota archaeon]|nr:hypothetical protein [Candidatus Thermoplasmatota archaeon]